MKKRKGILLLFATTIITLSNAQNKSKLKYEEIINSYSCSGSFDSIFVEALNAAYSAYPELQNVEIHYMKKPLKTIMAARPYFKDIFRPKDKRSYKIILSNNLSNNCDQLFCQIPEKALTGILGHELAHILTYNNKSAFQMVLYGMKYLFNKKSIERETDLLAIKYGFGDELLAYNIFVNNSNLVSLQYLRNRHNNYLSINEIQENLIH